jgi:hypothetical protein
MRAWVGSSWLLAAALCLAAGCGKAKVQSPAALDAGELLELLQAELPLAARNLVEHDLGRFRVSRAAEDRPVQVQFHLIGVLPAEREERLAELLPEYDKRLRDAVISLVQRVEMDQLADPALAYFKTEIVSAVNGVLREPIVRDVAFSDFSIANVTIPWSSPAEAPPKKSGGHGGH